MSGQNSSVLVLLACVQLVFVCSFGSAYGYGRLAAIEKQCGPYLSSALELNPDNIRDYNFKDELSFSNGEWEQEPNGTAPLMPFDENDMFWDWFSYAPPLRSVSLEITEKDVGRVNSTKNAVLVGGILSIGVHRNGSLGFGSGDSLGFSKRPGFSLLVMEFEGVYFETKENDGESLLCLLGNSGSSSGSYLPVFGTESAESEVEPDDLVLLVLRYPRMFNLTSQAIIGEMVSLSPPESVTHFDRVRISSQLGHYSRYQFSETVGSRDLHKSQHRDELKEEESVVLLSSNEFCKNFRDTPLIRFSIEQDGDMIRSISGLRKIGPFLLGKGSGRNNNWQHEELNLVMKPIKCEDESGKVSAVMRVVSESMDQETAVSRMGISEASMTAEGTWDQSKGKLHMVGCIGGTHTDLDKRCDSRIVLHFPKIFSVAQRSVITGNVSSTGDQNESFSPVRINLIVRPRDLVNYWYSTPCEYNYSEINLARELWERTSRSQPSNFISSIERAFIRYPSSEVREFGGVLPLSQLSLLSEKLRFRTRCFPIEFNKYHKTMYFLEAEMFSMGPLCGRYSPQQYDYNLEEDTSSRLLNVSVHLTYTVDDNVFTGRIEKSLTHLFLEGLYDTYSGEMSLVGCGNIEVGRPFSIVGPYADCSMAVRMRYSPVNTRWLKNPSVEIAIMSRRNVSDPLYFQPFTLRQISVYSPTHSQDVVFRVLFEGLLRVLVLVLDIGVISGQFLYMKKHPEVVPRISVVMLGVQILGYLVPLISSAEILIKPKESNSYAETRPYGDLGEHRLLIGIVDSGAKILLLIALLLMLRLFREVARSRTGPKTVASDDRKVLFITLAIHMLGLALAFAGPEVRFGAEYYYPVLLKKLMAASFENMENFFMLPQVIMNYLFENPGIPPVRTSYMFAFLISRWFLSSYDWLRDPILDPDSQYDWGFGFEPDKVVASGKTSLIMIIILLAAAMIIRNRWRKLKSGKSLCSKVFRFLPFVGGRFVTESVEDTSEMPLLVPEEENLTG